MVSLIGYSISYYTTTIVLTYVLLTILAIIRFVVERLKSIVWVFNKGEWKSNPVRKYLFVVPLLAIPVFLFIYAGEVRIGFVACVNGFLLALISVEASKVLIKYW